MFKKLLPLGIGLMLGANLIFAQDLKRLSGRVLDAQSHKPLPGANVVAQPTDIGALCNANGYFILNVPIEYADSLRVSFMGYRPVYLDINEMKSDVQIKLEATTLLFNEVLVTATRQPALRAKTPAAIELVEMNSPQTMARQNLGEVLATAQSVFVKEYGGVNGLKTINLRGAGDGQTLVLTDGVRLNNPQTGGVDASLFSLVGIDKIEIVRGNASAQYGSDAIGGVIHLRTFQPAAGFSGSVQTGGGSFGTFNNRAQLGFGRAKWNGVVMVDRLVSDGDFSLAEAGSIKRQNNATQRREVFARLTGNWRDDLRLSLLHRTNKIEQGVPGSLQFSSLLAQQKDLNHLTSATLDWSKNKWLQLAVQFSTERRDERYIDPNPFFPIDSRHEVASDIGSLQNRLQLHRRFDLLLGGEIGSYRLASTELGKPERTQRSAFAQAEWKPFMKNQSRLWQVQIVPSLRYDDYSDAGQRTSPKLAIGLHRESTTRLNLHGSVGRSFRVPSMNDLFWPAGPYVAGNPNLLPERGREIAGGVLYEFSRAGNWQLELAGFDSKIEDLIVWASEANFRFSPVNLETAKIRGVELSTAWRSHGDRFGWRAHYTRLSAKNAGDDPATRDKDLVYRPRDKFDLQANFDLRYLVLSGSLQLTGKRFSTVNNLKSLPAYRVANFSMSRRLGLGEVNALLHIEVRNLFDKHFSIVNGYPLPGREFRATLRLGN